MTGPYFNPDTPTVQLTFDDWQVQMQGNFDRMDQSFLTNHVPLEDPLKTGNHTIIQMPEQESDTKIQTNIGDLSIYTRLVDDQTDQVFIQHEGNFNEYQYTNYQIYQIKNIMDGKNIVQKTYFTTLPGKLMIIFGSKLLSKAKPPKPASIILIPPVIKNIVSVNITLIGTFPLAPARSFEVTPISNVVDEQTYFTSVDVNFSLGGFNPFYYLVMGNL